MVTLRFLFVDGLLRCPFSCLDSELSISTHEWHLQKFGHSSTFRANVRIVQSVILGIRHQSASWPDLLQPEVWTLSKNLLLSEDWAQESLLRTCCHLVASCGLQHCTLSPKPGLL